MKYEIEKKLLEIKKKFLSFLIAILSSMLFFPILLKIFYQNFFIGSSVDKISVIIACLTEVYFIIWSFFAWRKISMKNVLWKTKLKI